VTQPETYDLRGLNCPLPVLRTRKRLSDMAPGDRLVIETTDPLAAVDIPAFCNEHGHVLIAAESMAGGHRFIVEKGSGQARSA
jgi:tRNA 2-thiouridine synthesizing protein A